MSGREKPRWKDTCNRTREREGGWRTGEDEMEERNPYNYSPAAPDDEKKPETKKKKITVVKRHLATYLTMSCHSHTVYTGS